MKTIETIKQMIADGQISQEVAEKYFPELRESEDERIRKELVDFIYDKTDTYELREKNLILGLLGLKSKVNLLIIKDCQNCSIK
jgi:hypothetical protein